MEHLSLSLVCKASYSNMFVLLFLSSLAYSLVCVVVQVHVRGKQYDYRYVLLNLYSSSE